MVPSASIRPDKCAAEVKHLNAGYSADWVER